MIPWILRFTCKYSKWWHRIPLWLIRIFYQAQFFYDPEECLSGFCQDLDARQWRLFNEESILILVIFKSQNQISFHVLVMRCFLWLKHLSEDIRWKILFRLKKGTYLIWRQPQTMPDSSKILLVLTPHKSQYSKRKSR